MFARGHLTRMTGVDPRALTFAVLDLETTGLYPRKGSRICAFVLVATILAGVATLIGQVIA